VLPDFCALGPTFACYPPSNDPEAQGI
jgi:hypothetical protein